MSNKKESKLSYIDTIRLEYLRYKEILYDKITGLPTVPLLIETLRHILDRYHTIGVILIDLSKYGKYERAYGWERIDKIIKCIAQIIQKIVKKKEWKNNVISVNRARGDDIVLFVIPPKRKKMLDLEDLRKLGEKLVDNIISNMNKELILEFGKNFKIYSGYSLIFNDPNSRLERLIYQGIKEAEEMASNYEKVDKQYKISLLRRIIDTKDIKVVFQPIVDIARKEIIGYEALSRGPHNTEMENPEILFNIATEGDLVWELERVCREKALSYTNKMEKHQLLFLNNEPEVIYDPRFRSLEILRRTHTPPDRIVLEITERTAIKDFSAFVKAIKYFRSVGFKISIDDAGSGYASLKSIALLSPDFIKFDINLIRNIDSSLIKQNIVELLIQLAPKINAKIIAEGVETREELQTIQKMGVKYVQGFYFAHPGKAFPEVKFDQLS